MNRFFFAAALMVSSTVGGHAMAQERVAKAGAVKPARTAAAAKTTAATAAAPAAKSPTLTHGSTAADPHLTVSSGSGTVDEHLGQDLADVHGDSQSKSASGDERAVAAVVIGAQSAAPRAIATPRLLRRMNADRVTMKLADDFQACYATGSTDKTAAFAVVRVEVAPSGEVEGAKAESGAPASPAVASCIDASSEHAKFSAPGGIGTIVLVQVRTR
ncbi:MAG: hypothetical protein ACRELY_16320 [Polyangiaceae bacterium]